MGTSVESQPRKYPIWEKARRFGLFRWTLTIWICGTVALVVWINITIGNLDSINVPLLKLYDLDEANSKITNSRRCAKPPDFSPERVRGCAKDEAGNLWVVTTDNIYKLDPGGTRTEIAPVDSSGWNYSTREIAIDNLGRLWVNRSGGVSMLAPDGTWHTYIHGDVFSYPMILVDPQGRVWIWDGVQHYFFVFTPENDWTKFTPENTGIPDVSIERIALDGQGTIWVFPNGSEITNHQLVEIQGAVIVDDQLIETVKAYNIRENLFSQVYNITAGWIVLGIAALAIIKAMQMQTQETSVPEEVAAPRGADAVSGPEAARSGGTINAKKPAQTGKLGQLGIGFAIFCVVQFCLYAGMASPLGYQINFGWILVIPAANILALIILIAAAVRKNTGLVVLGYFIPIMIACILWIASIISYTLP